MKTEFKVSIVKQPKWSDPRQMKVDIDFPIVDTSDITEKGKSNRVMPLRKMGRFFALLHRSTKTFKAYDISHFWVSGYIQLDFYLKSTNDRVKIKKIVTDCILKSGGFMTLDEWLDNHNKEKKRTKIFVYAGSGSGIKGGRINTGYEYL